jgi:hypothetical protein
LGIRGAGIFCGQYGAEGDGLFVQGPCCWAAALVLLNAGAHLGIASRRGGDINDIGRLLIGEIFGQLAFAGADSAKY